jgi:hypothetical protein
MPYADDGGTSWNNTKCVPVMEDPAQPGEPCFVVGNGVSGIDNCDVGAMCWDTDVEDQGTCVAGCRGTADAPYCEDPAAVCWSTRVFTLCIKGCDPLEQDCPMADDLCIPSDHTFVCVLDASGEEGQVHDPCMFPNECDEGLYCVDSSSAAECDAQVMGCCQPFCDLDVPEPDTQCAGEGQQCVAWYAEGTALPGSEDIGICMVPK